MNRKFKNLTTLQQAVIKQLGYNTLDEDAASTLNDVMRSHYGAAAGFTGFIYYNDTIKFFNDNKNLIMEQLENDANDFGEDMLTMISNFNCLKDDNLSATDIMNAIYNEEDENETIVKNALSWYALETVAYQLED